MGVAGMAIKGLSVVLTGTNWLVVAGGRVARLETAGLSACARAYISVSFEYIYPLRVRCVCV